MYGGVGAKDQAFQCTNSVEAQKVGPVSDSHFTEIDRLPGFLRRQSRGGYEW